jgi:MoaA/NifB/PqqE/SkfB family radical SAM enzyme
LGLRPVISSNGTLIDDQVAEKIKAAGFQYVGISIDGGPETHDHFRNHAGAFDMALRGIRTCLEKGIKTGIRFTVNKYNQEDLPVIFDMVEKEGIPRFCMYHLVYAGRGAEMANMDTSSAEKISILDYVSQKTLELAAKG